METIGYLRKILCPTALLLGLGTFQLVHSQNLFKSELDLPVRGTSQRTTVRTDFEPGASVVLFDQDKPGCIFHWWLTFTWQRERMMQDLVVRFYYDGEAAPAVEVTLAQYFSVLLDKEVYPVDNAALKILPRNALNCYFPIPYRKLRIELHNSGERMSTIWFMADFHEYEPEQELTPLRFRVFAQESKPAGPSHLMANLSGRGFIACMTKAVRVLEEGDAWYHSGGDLWLLDGETNPHAIRGIGGEDVFNMSFGVWPVQTDWVGTLFKSENSTPRTRGFEVIMYRIFGPAPVWFDQSAIIRFGARPNDIESIIYAYLEPAEDAQLLTPDSWRLAAPFDLDPEKEFQQQNTWADGEVSAWPSRYVPDFGEFVTENTKASFPIPAIAGSERGWVDFTRHFRGINKTNPGTQPAQVFGYATGDVTVYSSGHYIIRLGFDDDAILWIDGQMVYQGTHDRGFKQIEIPSYLSEGTHQIKIKLSNLDNMQWRLWAFNFSVLANPD